MIVLVGDKTGFLWEDVDVFIGMVGDDLVIRGPTEIFPPEMFEPGATIMGLPINHA